MILADTSVWVDHLRRAGAELRRLLLEGAVLGHPFVMGELACGSLANREEILGLLARLPSAALATHDEAMSLVESARLARRGLGWVDVHLLASARLSRVPLWTRDRRLSAAAASLGIGV